jgi:outer membrane protein insertion porin family
MKKNIILAIIIIFLSLNSFAAKINTIIISGNNRIENKTIEKYLDVKLGDEFIPSLDEEIIKKLYKTGLFKNIQVKFLNGTLNIYIKEKILINKVNFEGNKKIKSDLKFKLLKRNRSRIAEAFKSQNLKKNGRTIKYLD